MKRAFPVLLILVLLIMQTPGVLLAQGTVSGVAFRDYDADGAQGSEPGIEGVVVTLYDSAGAAQGTAATNGSGSYSITAGGSGPYRVEFTLPSDGSLDFYEAGAAGDTTVQFVAAGGASGIDAGFSSPADYCQADPMVATGVSINGNPQGGDSAGSGGALYSWTYSDTGDIDGTGGPDQVATASQIGAVWGEAYQRSTSTLFVGAFMKRHVGFGPQGPGGVYAIDFSNPASPVVSNWLDVDSLASVSVDADPHSGLPADAGDPSHDINSFGKVGRMSLGDLDISADEQTLYVMHVDEDTPEMLAIDIASKALAGSYAVPEPSVGCTSDEYAPWAIKVHEGSVYVGVVCTDELSAHVLAFDGTSIGSTPVLNINLDYDRGSLNAWDGSLGGDGSADWNPWTDNYLDFDGSSDNRTKPQAIFSDIEFDTDGSMIIGLMDRAGHQLGYRNYLPVSSNTSLYSTMVGGDILRACLVNGNFELESNGACGGVTTTGAGNDQGPDGGEFYFEEYYSSYSSGPHDEIFTGGLALLPGSDEVMGTIFDPFELNTGGTMKFSSSTGEASGHYEIYEHSTTAGTFAKANGLGDLELFCDPAPIEIGNRIWADTNNDGIQDPGEDGINGVDVTLTCGSDSATATTAGDGQFLFTNESGGNATFMDANESCTLSVDTTQLAIATPGYILTVANTAQPANGNAAATDNDSISDVADSDATPSGDDAVIIYTTGGPGANNHGLDFGFTQATLTPAVSIGSYVWFDANTNGTQDGDESGLAGATAQLLVDSGGSNYVAAVDTDGTTVPSQNTGSDGLYYFNNLPEGTYKVRVTPPAGYAPTSVQSTGAINGSSNTNIVENDSNIASSGGSGAATYYESGAVTLTLSGEPTESGSYPGDAQDNGSETNGNMTVDFGFTEPATIGNYVWVDEDSNGYQDEGERGIPNVKVVLKDTSGSIVAETYTDSHGGYLFDSIPPAVYYVDIVDGTIPTGMTQTTIYTNIIDGDDIDILNDDGDFGNKDHSGNGYQVSVVAGEENLTADFGYNYNPTPDVNDPSGSPKAALGDRLWIDSDGDGVQDPNEVGVSGVKLALYDAGPDGIFDTGADGIYGTSDDDSAQVGSATTTDDNGYYLFDDLTPGGYVVVVIDNSDASHPIPVADDGQIANGYTQTGDPDHFAATDTSADNNDGQSTLPVILGPGDVFLNVDFGYQPSGAATGAIGDTVWLDVDASGTPTQDAGEPGIPGVTVVLIQDTNGDGSWQAGEPIIATDTTDENGNYLFDGLSLNDGDGDADYIVWVNDTDNVLDGLAQTYDEDSPLDDMSATALSSGTPSDLNQDFSYTPEGHTSALGAIGDTVWFDTNNSGGNQTSQGDEPGIEGVEMELCESTPVLAGGTYADHFDGGSDYSNSTQPPGTIDWSAMPWTENNDDGNADNGDVEIISGEVRFSGNSTLPQRYLERTLGDLSGADSATWSYDWRGVGGWDATQDKVYIQVYNGSSWEDLPGSPIDGANVGGQSDSVSYDLFLLLGAGERSDVRIRIGAMSSAGAEEIFFDNIEVEVVSTSSGTCTTPLATTVTDENGNYLFGGLPLDTTYQVRVADENFDPNGVLEGLDETYAAGATVGGHEGNDVTLTAAVPVNLDQDFSYYATTEAGSIGNRVWLDQNADGIWDGDNGPDGVASSDDDEPGIAGVTIDLYRDLDGNGAVDPGEPRIATDTTDASGLYLFPGLPYDSYVVDVTDEDGILNGYWHSLSPTQDPTTNNGNDPADNSKVDPFAVSIDGTIPNNLNVDFGYYVEPAAVGNYVWIDSNANGLQDDGETGVNDVEVVLEITYPSGTVTTLTTLTVDDSSGNPGYYDFGNLLLDEDYNGDGAAPEPTFVISVDETQTALAGYSPTTADVNTNGNDLEDSDDFAGVTAQPVQGLIDTTALDPETNEPVIASYDFGLLEEDLDWGDLPDDGAGTGADDYQTLTADSGPSHVITTDLYLGACVDSESDGQSSSAGAADQDDANTGSPVEGACAVAGDDEDGIKLVQPAVAGHETCVHVTAQTATSQAAKLYGWVDFEADGSMADAGDEILSGVAVNSGTLVSTGVYEHCFDVPASADHGGTLYSRFRLSTDSGLSYTGAATDGEVEDYANDLVCIGNYLWFDDGDGIQGTGTETAVGVGIQVTLIWGGPDGLISTTGDNLTYTTVTETGGTYHFCGIKPDADENGTPDEYQVVVYNAPGTPVTADAATNDHHDSDGTPDGTSSKSHIITIPLTINVTDDALNDVDPRGYGDDQTDLTIDFGFSDDGPLAVTLGYAHAEANSDGSISFTWETVTEGGVAGFNLYMEADGQDVLVTPQMVPSVAIDSVEVQRYSHKAAAEAVAEGDRYYIEVVNISGSSERYGPFVVGQAAGLSGSGSPIFLPFVVRQ